MELCQSMHDLLYVVFTIRFFPTWNTNDFGEWNCAKACTICLTSFSLALQVASASGSSCKASASSWNPLFTVCDFFLLKVLHCLLDITHGDSRPLNTCLNVVSTNETFHNSACNHTCLFGRCGCNHCVIVGTNNGLVKGQANLYTKIRPLLRPVIVHC